MALTRLNNRALASDSQFTADQLNVGQLGGRRNMIINGAMQVSQRTTSQSLTSGSFTLDRWFTSLGSMGTHTVSQEQDGPEGFDWSYKVLCTTAATDRTGSQYLQVEQKLEGFNIAGLNYGDSSAKKLTVSFWVKTNKVGKYNVRLYIPISPYPAIHQQINVTQTDVWVKYSITFDGYTGAVPLNKTVSEGFRFTIWLDGGAGFRGGNLVLNQWSDYETTKTAEGNTTLADTVGNYFQFTGVQMEVGEVATPFEHRSYGEELALCQRYYQHEITMKANELHWTGTGGYYGGPTYLLPVTMRANPSITKVADGTYSTSIGSTSQVSHQNMTVEANTNYASFHNNVTGSTIYGCKIQIRLDAEL